MIRRASNTTSLSESVTDFKFKNGRRYHAYKEGCEWRHCARNRNEDLLMGSSLHLSE